MDEEKSAQKRVVVLAMDGSTDAESALQCEFQCSFLSAVLCINTVLIPRFMRVKTSFMISNRSIIMPLCLMVNLCFFWWQ